MNTYYNEIEPYAAAWLRNLISAGEISPGTVDTRSILDVTPEDLAGYDRCHFFAGIAGWELALKLADWPANQRVWTGSCPCQPFSSAGRGGGGSDERHLWPAWFWLIRQCRPPVIFGEQVASKAGLSWLDVVFSDLEAAGYAVGAADLCAAGLGAPHIRQRLWFVAHLPSAGLLRKAQHKDDDKDLPGRRRPDSTHSSKSIGILGHAQERGCERNLLHPLQPGGDREGQESCPSGPGPTGELADSEGGNGEVSILWRKPQQAYTELGGGGGIDNPWFPLHWLPCRDGKWRPTKSGLLPLASRIPGRVGQLRSAGNSIVPQVAAAFIQAVMESEEWLNYGD